MGAPCLQNFIHQVGNAEDVLIRLRRQAEHKVQLDVIPPALKGRRAGRQDFLLRDVFVDGVAQALRSGLRREGQSALAHLLELVHQLSGKVIRTQGRKRQVDLARRAVVQHPVRKFRQAAVVRGGKAGKRNLVTAGLLQKLGRLPKQNLRRARANRPVAEARLTEAAAADAAAHHLEIRTVVYDLHIRNDHIRRIERIVQIADDALRHCFGRAVQRRDGRERTVRAVGMLIKGRHIDALDLRDGKQEVLFAPILPLCLPVKGQNFAVDLLPLTQNEKVDKIG